MGLVAVLAGGVSLAKPRPLFGGDLVIVRKRQPAKKQKKQSAVLNSISFVTGPLGCGKSYFAMKQIMEQGSGGRHIACNFDLTGAWWATMRRMNPDARRLSADDARAWEDECRRRVHRFDQMDDLYDFKLPGKGEGRGLLVLDEGGLNMNSRLYQMRQKQDAAKSKEKDGKENPIKSLQFYINMRKRGWTCLILAHSAEHLDNQVQAMGGGIIKLRNFARVKIPIVGISLSKNPRFYARYFTPDISSTIPEYRQMYGLNPRIAAHYESMQEFEFMPESGGIRLQREPGSLGRAADGLGKLEPILGGGAASRERRAAPAQVRTVRFRGLRRIVRRVLVRD